MRILGIILIALLSFHTFTFANDQLVQNNDGIYYVSSWKKVVDFGYANGLTMYDNVQQFRPADGLLREESTKFFVQTFKELFSSSSLSSSSSCIFSDITGADPTLIEFIIESCELGIFKGSNGQFFPIKKLSNAEAITVVMRMIHGMLDETGTPWHAAYYDTFKLYADESSSVSAVYNRMLDADADAKRGDVLEMIYVLHTYLYFEDDETVAKEAIDKGLETKYCQDQEVVFACTLDPDGSMGLCPMECLGHVPQNNTNNSQETENSDDTAPGEIRIGSSNSNASQKTLPPQYYSSVPFGDIIISASNGDVRIDSLSFQFIGDTENISRAHLEQKGIRITKRESLDGANVTLYFVPSLFVRVGESETLSLVAELDLTALEEYVGTVSASYNNVSSNASNVEVGNISFTTINFDRYYYNSPTINFSSVGADTLVSVGEEVAIGSFQLNIPDINLYQLDGFSFNHISFRNIGTAPVSNLSNIKLYHGSTFISDGSIQGNRVRFNPNVAWNKSSATLTIYADIDNEISSDLYYELNLDNGTYLQFGYPNGMGSPTTGEGSLGKYTIQ